MKIPRRKIDKHTLTKLTRRQIDLLEEYDKGDTIAISVKDYAKIFNKYLLNIGTHSGQRIFTEEKISKEISNGKMTRPLLVIWNHPYSNYIIVSSMTTQKHISSNFEIRSGSYASFDALIMDKNKIFTSFNGKIFDSIDEKTMSQFLTEFQKRSKSYALLMGKISEYQLIANNREMNIKNKLIEELMKSK